MKNIMCRIMLIFLAVLLVLSFTGCSDSSSKTVSTFHTHKPWITTPPPTMTPSVEPMTPSPTPTMTSSPDDESPSQIPSSTPSYYENLGSPLGSAKTLEGNCVFITVEVIRYHKKYFSEDALRTVLTPAMDTLTEKAAVAGKTFNPIYLEQDLIAHVALKGPTEKVYEFSGTIKPLVTQAKEDYPRGYRFPLNDVQDVMSKFNIEKIKQKYNADNICFIFFIPDGFIDANSYSLTATSENTLEAAFIFASTFLYKEEKQENVDWIKEIIAENILSLFDSVP